VSTKQGIFKLTNLFNLHSDAFQRRERAQEEMYIRKAEKEKLLALRAKIKEQQDHLQQLSDHM